MRDNQYTSRNSEYTSRGSEYTSRDSEYISKDNECTSRENENALSNIYYTSRDTESTRRARSIESYRNTASYCAPNHAMYSNTPRPALNKYLDESQLREE